MTFKSSILALCALALVFVTGCAGKEKLDHFHRGNKIIERHYIPGSWDMPSDISKTECRPEQMEWSIFWGKKVCPDTIDKNATLAVDRGSVTTASYKDLVVPATIKGLFDVAAFGTFAAVMPKMDVRVNQANYGSPINASTVLFNAPVPGGVAK